MEMTEKKKFDTKVDIFDSKTGQKIKHQPYLLHVEKTGSGVTQVYERNGKKYNPDGTQIEEAHFAENVKASTKSTKTETVKTTSVPFTKESKISENVFGAEAQEDMTLS